LLWGKDLEKVFDQIVGVWPESGSWFSPEWIARWGKDPSEILDTIGEGDNDAVNELDPVITPSGEVSLEGKSPYQVYSLANTGRLAHYEWERANIVKQYRIRHPLGVYGPHDSDEKIISDWHKVNKQPAPLLTYEQVKDQVGLRITCARIDAAPGFGIRQLFVERNPSKKANFVKDPLLDWISYTDPQGFEFLWVEGALAVNIMDKASPRPYDYSKRRFKGIRQIALYAFWSPPISAP